MNASFEEKSVWIQAASIVLCLGAYFVVAGLMLAQGVRALPAFVPLFAAAVVLIVVVNVGGHVAAAIARRPEQRDERDRVIAWRAESNSGWVLAAGVFCAISGLVVAVPSVWIAHLLLVSLFLSEVLRCAFQIVYYRRGL